MLLTLITSRTVLSYHERTGTTRERRTFLERCLSYCYNLPKSTLIKIYSFHLLDYVSYSKEEQNNKRKNLTAARLYITGRRVYLVLLSSFLAGNTLLILLIWRSLSSLASNRVIVWLCVSIIRDIPIIEFGYIYKWINLLYNLLNITLLGFDNSFIKGCFFLFFSYFVQRYSSVRTTRVPVPVKLLLLLCVCVCVFSSLDVSYISVKVNVVKWPKNCHFPIFLCLLYD